MKVAVTGARGFIGSSLVPCLQDKGHVVVDSSRYGKHYDLLVSDHDIIIHLAGVNKGTHEEMLATNTMLTLELAELCYKFNKKLIYAGAMCRKNNSYTLSKQIATEALLSYCVNLKCDFCPVLIPRVIGKGCKPFYNSFVSTVAYMFAKGDITYQITNPNEWLSFVWIDDLCEEFSHIVERSFIGQLLHSGYPLKSIFYMKMGDVVSCIEGKSGAECALKFQQLVEYYKTYELPKT